MEVIPLQRLYDEAEAEESGSLEDSLVRRLLHWFKNDFFVWVNNAPCDYCSNVKRLYFIAKCFQGIYTFDRHKLNQ